MNILILGGDERNLYLTKKLISSGYGAKWCCAEKYGDIAFENADVKEGIRMSDAIVLPLPLTKDGETLNCPYGKEKISLDEIKTYIKDKKVFTSDSGIDGINYFSDKGVTIENARLTAVGFLSELLKAEKSDIMGKNALVTGFGNVSECVCKILTDNGVRVFVAARDPVQRHKASVSGYGTGDFAEAEKIISDFDYIVNTVPSKVISDNALSKIRADSLYFELASFVLKETEKYQFAYIDCRGMPGKHTPKGAGEVIADFIRSELRE